MLKKKEKIILKIIAILFLINCDNRNRQDDHLDNPIKNTALLISYSLIKFIY
ncbi:MAG: hypothetical protein GY830_02760 [Bacteroidetes bacterium]|nr:hypothetical protein [Bacteroidota bacterium]